GPGRWLATDHVQDVESPRRIWVHPLHPLNLDDAADRLLTSTRDSPAIPHPYFGCRRDVSGGCNDRWDESAGGLLILAQPDPGRCWQDLSGAPHKMSGKVRAADAKG